MSRQNREMHILFILALEKAISDISVIHEMQLNGNNVILAYTDETIILRDVEIDIVSVTEKLIESQNYP